MRKLLNGTAMLLVMSGTAVAAPVLSVTATDNALALVFVPATNVPGDLTGSFIDPNFSQITVDLTGVPSVASPDFGTVTLQVLGATAGHTLDIVASQTGLSQPAGFNGELTMSNNNLIGGPGPVTQTFSINGTAVNTFTFPANPAQSTSQNFADNNLAAITSETQEFKATFSTAGQDLEATMEFTAAPVAAIPEVGSPGTLALLGTALLMLLGLRPRRRGC